jgi:hypothetical protein
MFHLKGTIIEYSICGDLAMGVKYTEESVQDGTDWLFYPKYDFKEFFKMWEAKLKSLEWVPMPIDDDSGEIWDLETQYTVKHKEVSTASNLYFKIKRL